MKYLGLDVGKKAIGVAVGEALASELQTLEGRKGEDFYQEPARSRSYDELKKILEDEGARAVVVGLPVKEDGSHSEESAKIEVWADGLAASLGVPVHRVDETLTSFMARDILESQTADEAEIERRIHQLSAQLILQQYLEEKQ
jgi:putative holliday junction resolvase